MDEVIISQSNVCTNVLSANLGDLPESLVDQQQDRLVAVMQRNHWTLRQLRAFMDETQHECRSVTLRAATWAAYDRLVAVAQAEQLAYEQQRAQYIAEARETIYGHLRVRRARRYKRVKACQRCAKLGRACWQHARKAATP